jgi:hypothetical protein
MGKADNCCELNLLRRFREGYLMQTAVGQVLVREYYRFAPKLVTQLSRLPDAQSYWMHIYRTLVTQSCTLINQHRGHEAVTHYVSVIREAHALLEDRPEATSADGFGGDLGEPSLYLIDPGTARRSKMQYVTWAPSKPVAHPGGFVSG